MTRDSARAPRPAPRRPAAVTAPRGPAPGRDRRRTALPYPRRRAFGRREAAPLVAADCLAALTGLGAARPAAGPLLLAPLLCALLYGHHRAGLHRPGFAPTALGELPSIVARTTLAWVFTAAALAASAPARALGWRGLLTGAAVTALGDCALRALVHRWRRRAARRHPGSTLVVGAEPAVGRITALLQAHPEYGMRPVGVAACGGSAPGGPPLPVPVLRGHGEITRAVIQNSVRHAVVAGPPALDARTTATVRLLAARGCRIWQLESGPGPVPAAHLWGHGCRPLEPGPRPGPAAGRRAKRALDAVGAALALLCLAPLLALCALAVRLADGPGVLFRQERIGLGGRPFTLLKFRTLRPADAHESATRWSVAHDRRMSAAGRLLRKTSLDELPQLWNVLRGDMSLVGPRPERPYFVRQFSRTYPGYGDRHRMPAGITGLAQVHGLRGDTSIADRARFDNHYIDSWSLWQDLAILLRTASSVFRLGGS